jgi:hypothetical protein
MIAPAPPPLFGTEAHRPMMYSAAHQSTVLGSTPTRQPSISPQLPFTSQTIYSVAAEAPLPPPAEGFSHHTREWSDSARIGGETCEEAYQVVRFGGGNNQCFFGLEDDALHDLAEPNSYKNDNSTVPNQSTDSPRVEASKQNTTSQQNLSTSRPPVNPWKDSYYPFISPPTKRSDIALAQLNGYNPWLDPGQPPELTITRCNPKPRTAAGRQVKVMDNAVRPIVHDWNEQWELEEIICVLNDEAFMYCTEFREEEKEEEEEEEEVGIAQTDTQENESPLVITPASPDEPVVRVVKQPATTPKKRRLYRARGRRCHSSTKKWQNQRRRALSNLKQSTTKKVSRIIKKIKVPEEESVQEVCQELVVSIPFQKLMTERQKKKYCDNGGKYRIPTK